jgi:hypothetical protein
MLLRSPKQGSKCYLDRTCAPWLLLLPLVGDQVTGAVPSCDVTRQTSKLLLQSLAIRVEGTFTEIA